MKQDLVVILPNSEGAFYILLCVLSLAHGCLVLQLDTIK